MIKEMVKRWYYDDERGFKYTFNPIEDTIKVKQTEDGFTVKYLIQDNDPDSPQEHSDGTVFLVHYHRDFTIREDSLILEASIRVWYQGEKIPHTKDYHIFPVSAYIHSGVSLSLNTHFQCDTGGWDTSHVGAVLVSKKEFKKKEKAIKVAENLIKYWNMYLGGDVYAMVSETYDKDKNQLDYEVCGGSYGYKESVEALETEI